MQTNHRLSVSLTRPLIGAAVLATLAALAFLLLNPMGSNAASAKGTLVSTTSTSLGRVLVDSRGHTLYLFAKDKNGKSACAGMCATLWPPLISNAKPRVAGGAKASLMGAIKRADGRRQVTYNHHPLYTFVKDTKKGQTNGEGVNAFGANWYAVSPTGAKVLRKPKPVQTGIPQNNGGDHDSDNNGGPSDGDGNI